MLAKINLVINFFTNSILKINSLECMSMINQKCKANPKLLM